MSGPSAGDYYSAAKYYYNQELDKKKSLEWINKAVELREPQLIGIPNCKQRSWPGTENTKKPLKRLKFR